MKTQKLAIWILSITASLLLCAVVFVKPQQAKAELSIKDRDYSVVTSAMQGGGDALWVADNGTGQVAVFEYDQRAGSLVVRSVMPLANIAGNNNGR